jgi:IclR family transcriptional regulator, KDG regulon repressor
MKESSQTLSRGLRLLSLLADEGEGKSVRELAALTGLSRTIVQRLLNSLEAEGFIERRPAQIGYRLSIKMWRLGSRVLSDVGVRELARPFLEALARRADETVKLSVLDELDVVSLDRVDCSQALRAYVPIGGRAPARSAATGKVILAFRDLAEPAGSIAVSASETAEFKQIRKRGYAINRGEWEPAVGAVAAPIFDSRDNVVASVGVILPLVRLSPARASQFGAWCMEAARDISEKLGHAPSSLAAPMKRVG